LEELSIGNNQLTTLSLPDTLKRLNCSKNNITLLKLNEQLLRVNVSHNPLVTVPRLPESLCSINFKFTKVENCFEITHKFIDHGIIHLYGSPLFRKIKAVLNVDEATSCPLLVKFAFERINIIEARFKGVYYSMKAKARMLAWMWRARENIAMKKYHPDELLKRLDDYDAIEQW
jgi:hypothetical protein